MATVAHPPHVRVRIGRPLHLSGADAVKETERLMSAITALLPKEARKHRQPTAEELKRTYPPGRRATTSATQKDG